MVRRPGTDIFPKETYRWQVKSCSARNQKCKPKPQWEASPHLSEGLCHHETWQIEQKLVRTERKGTLVHYWKTACKCLKAKRELPEIQQFHSLIYKSSQMRTLIRKDNMHLIPIAALFGYAQDTEVP